MNIADEDIAFVARKFLVDSKKGKSNLIRYAVDYFNCSTLSDLEAMIFTIPRIELQLRILKETDDLPNDLPPDPPGRYRRGAMHNLSVAEQDAIDEAHARALTGETVSKEAMDKILRRHLSLYNYSKAEKQYILRSIQLCRVVS